MEPLLKHAWDLGAKMAHDMEQKIKIQILKESI